MALTALPAAAAEPGIPWPTYLRTAPAWSGSVLQEVGRGSVYETLGCEGGWCRIRLEGETLGYVPERALRAPPALRPGMARNATAIDCIGYLRHDDRGPQPELLCRPAAPP